MVGREGRDKAGGFGRPAVEIYGEMRIAHVGCRGVELYRGIGREAREGETHRQRGAMREIMGEGRGSRQGRTLL